MTVSKEKYYKINNSYFTSFCVSVERLLATEDGIISNLHIASLDDNDKSKHIYLYDGKINNMDAVKLDDLSKSFQEYMRNQRSLKDFEQPKAVDAVCINKDNEWFLIEFKNSPMIIQKEKKSVLNRDVITSIRQKMLSSLWFLFTMDSFESGGLFGDDVTEFARNHISYIVVISRDKNPEEFRRINESHKRMYTPDYLKKYVGYYFKDVFLFTEQELARFIKDFKC